MRRDTESACIGRRALAMAKQQLCVAQPAACIHPASLFNSSVYIPQGLNGYFLRSFTMVILLAVCRGERCNYKEIYETYRNIILVELRSLVRRGGGVIC